MLWHKEVSQLIGKKPKCYGIKKYRTSMNGHQIPKFL